MTISTDSPGGLSAEQEAIRETAARFADEVLAPCAAEWDRERRFPRHVIDELGGLGFMGACVPTEHGGAGADFLAYILVLEELSRGDAGVGATVAVHTSAVTLPILAHGSDAQIERIVPRLAAGETLGAFALTEAGAGSDAAAIEAAHRDGALYGEKQWTTNGEQAGWILAFARDEEVDGRISAFLVEGSAHGLEVTREEEKLGLRSSITSDLRFDGVAAERLGPPGAGLGIAFATLDGGRIGIAAQAVGIAEAALRCAVAHARERQTFGRAIGAHQAIQQKLAEMDTGIAAARQLTWHAARLKQGDRPHSIEGARAKLLASRVAREVTSDAIQVLGGAGYTTQFPVERHYRDAKVTEIYEGTSEIQRMVIARGLLGDVAR